MKQLTEMTLVELNEASRLESAKPAAIFAELARRQAMLDSAEGMYLAIGDQFLGQAKAAYAAAKSGSMA